MNRRRFLRAVVYGTPCAAVGYGLFEAGWFCVDRQTIPVPRLPPSFANKTVALLTDLHHGPFTGLGYIRDIVTRTNALAPDLIVLGGDYCHKGAKYITPCLEVLADLRAPLGVFGVLGNHDHWDGRELAHRGLAAAGIHDLTNAGRWLTIGPDRLRIAGVDDLWEGRQDLDAALADATSSDACLLLSHNPDYAETLTDRRVGLVLSGHTHGGQILLPGNGYDHVPSRYGAKYLAGL